MYYIEKKNKLIIAHIPKSGCQSIRKMLLESNNQYKDHSSLWEGNIRKYIIRDFTRFNNYTKIAIVRNPYERLISGYKDKILTDNYKFLGFSKELKREKNLSDDVRISFKDFVYYIKNNRNKLDPHFKPQTTLFDVRQFKILKIGKINLESFFKKYNLKYEQVKGHEKTCTDNNLTSTETLHDKDYTFFKKYIDQNTFFKYELFLTPELKEIIYDVYKRDFQLLKYDF